MWSETKRWITVDTHGFVCLVSTTFLDLLLFWDVSLPPPILSTCLPWEISCDYIAWHQTLTTTGQWSNWCLTQVGPVENALRECGIYLKDDRPGCCLELQWCNPETINCHHFFCLAGSERLSFWNSREEGSKHVKTPKGAIAEKKVWFHWQMRYCLIPLLGSMRYLS